MKTTYRITETRDGQSPQYFSTFSYNTAKEAEQELSRLAKAWMGKKKPCSERG